MKIDSAQIPRVCSFCESKNGFLILSANQNPNFCSGESFFKKAQLHLKAKESNSRLMN